MSNDPIKYEMIKRKSDYAEKIEKLKKKLGIEHLVYAKDATDEDMYEVLLHLESNIIRKKFISVIYNPDCGCPIDNMVVLDRYPMSSKILFYRCPHCLKGCTMEISNPIIFHSKLLDEYYPLEDLINMHITDSPQKPFLEAYRQEAILNNRNLSTP
jgi:hypothetical protein